MQRLEANPLLAAAVFETELPAAPESLPTPAELLALLRLDATAPLQRDEAVRTAVRDMLRHDGYKPTGRGKPASEYLARAAEEGGLRSINLPVDACNAVSLHSGFPISVIDLELATAPLRLAVAGAGESYVFNASEQVIELAGLPCIYDALGACGNAVKDSQRTKTRPETRRTLSVIWGTALHVERVGTALAWYRGMLEACGASTRVVAL